MERDQQSAVVEMTCIQVRALIVDYLEGDVGLDGYIRVDAHLGHCDHCSSIYDGVRNVVALLASDDLFEVPSGLDVRLSDLLARSSSANSF